MPRSDVLDRLKQATADRVPAAVTGPNGLSTDRTPDTDRCHNCGQDALSVSIGRRQLVPDQATDDGNVVSLCDDCHAAAPTADSQTATDGGAVAGSSTDAARTQPADATAASTTYDTCRRSKPPFETALVLDRDEHRCRGCGVRETIVVGDDLHVHPVVPTDGSGHRHPHNYVSVCPTCHRKLHD